MRGPASFHLPVTISYSSNNVLNLKWSFAVDTAPLFASTCPTRWSRVYWIPSLRSTSHAPTFAGPYFLSCFFPFPLFAVARFDFLGWAASDGQTPGVFMVLVLFLRPLPVAPPPASRAFMLPSSMSSGCFDVPGDGPAFFSFVDWCVLLE